MIKRRFGPWMMPLFHLLKWGKVLRGTRLDPFGRTEERQAERAWIAEYETWLDRFERELSAENFELCLALAALPEKIRGFGHVKERAMREARAEAERLWARFTSAAAA